ESVSYHGAKRYVWRIVPRKQYRSNDRLRRKGIYLIAGGMGGIGFAIAEHLASTYSARLILLGRSPYDDRVDAKVRRLRGLGAEALYISVDVTDSAALLDAVAIAKSRFGAVNGVIHAAGIGTTAASLPVEFAAMERVWAPKIAGTLALDEALGEEPLDFVCYF